MRPAVTAPAAAADLRNRRLFMALPFQSIVFDPSVALILLCHSGAGEAGTRNPYPETLRDTYSHLWLWIPGSALHCAPSRNDSARLPFYALAQHALDPGYRDIHDHGERREHRDGDPDERDVVGLAGIEDGAPEAVLGGDEFAHNGPGERQADIHPQHRDDPG